MSAKVVHFLQCQGVLSLQRAVSLGRLSDPGGEALVGGVPGRQHGVGRGGQVMLHLGSQLLALCFDLCNNRESVPAQSSPVTPLTVRLLDVPVRVSLPADRVPQSSVLSLNPAVKLIIISWLVI